MPSRVAVGILATGLFFSAVELNPSVIQASAASSYKEISGQISVKAETSRSKTDLQEIVRVGIVEAPRLTDESEPRDMLTANLGHIYDRNEPRLSNLSAVLAYETPSTSAYNLSQSGQSSDTQTGSNRNPSPYGQSQYSSQYGSYSSPNSQKPPVSGNNLGPNYLRSRREEAKSSQSPMTSRQQNRSSQSRTNEKKTEKRKKRGPLPLWLTQFVMLSAFGGIIYSITLKYDTTSQLLSNVYTATDKFLLSLRVSYDQTSKK